jgi:hypothetical protein
MARTIQQVPVPSAAIQSTIASGGLDGAAPASALASLLRHHPRRPASRPDEELPRLLTAVLPNAILRAIVVAIRGSSPRSRRGEAAEVCVDQRARRVRQLRGGLALCLAVLLAIPPLAQLSPSVAPQAALAASAPSYAPDGNAPHDEEPTLGLPVDRPKAGILPRLLHLEAAFALPPQKAPFATPDRARGALVAPEATGKLKPDTGNVLHYSSIRTARTPTGPPV